MVIKLYQLQSIAANALLGNPTGSASEVQSLLLDTSLFFNNSKLAAALTNTYIGVGDGSNALSGSNAFKFNGTQVTVKPSSGRPILYLEDSTSTYWARIINSTTDITYLGTSSMDMTVIQASNKIGLLAGSSFLKVDSASNSIELWCNYGEKFSVIGSTVFMKDLATWGNPQMLTVGYGGDIGKTPIIPTAGNSYSPTITNDNNTGSLSVSNAVYTRVDNIVDVSVRGQFDVSGTSPSFKLSLPVNKSFTNKYDVIGQGVIFDLSNQSTAVTVGGVSNTAIIEVLTDLAGTATNSGTTYYFSINFKYKL